MLNKPKYLVIHTAAHGDQKTNHDTTIEQIDIWHKKRNFRMIGYHYLIRHDGTVEKGRKDSETGAHTRGLNSTSLGICLSGHHDYHPWTEPQKKSLHRLVKQLMGEHSIPAKHVIGHREAGRNGNPGRMVNKSCPGKLIDPARLRASLTDNRLSEDAVRITPPV